MGSDSFQRRAIKRRDVYIRPVSGPTTSVRGAREVGARPPGPRPRGCVWRAPTLVALGSQRSHGRSAALQSGCGVAAAAAAAGGEPSDSDGADVPTPMNSIPLWRSLKNGLPAPGLHWKSYCFDWRFHSWGGGRAGTASPATISASA
eukprot:COSAG02_NODE_1346_length_13140_cov_106.669964_1_plen_147_part_00